MTRRLMQLSIWFYEDPIRIRLAVFAIIVALSVAGALIPGHVVFADDAPGGSINPH